MSCPDCSPCTAPDTMDGATLHGLRWRETMYLRAAQAWPDPPPGVSAGYFAAAGVLSSRYRCPVSGRLVRLVGGDRHDG